MMPQKICVVTGSRADYGLLQPLLKLFKRDSKSILQIIATGSHLSKAHGLTYKEIINDGFTISKKIEILNKNDSSTLGIVDAKAVALNKLSHAYAELKPELLIVLGDRYEIHAAVEAALFHKIPVAHIAGGDITQGSFDDALRHSISKMSHLHFTTCAESAQRVLQMGEDDKNVFNVGHLGIDQIKHIKLLNRLQLARNLNIKFLKTNILVTFHPSTLDPVPAVDQAAELLRSLSGLNNTTGIFFTKSNADPEGLLISKLVDRFVAKNSNSKAFESLGHRNYLSLMAQVDMVVGNSSSGIYEAPSFKIPTINIGNRQKGRLCATSVIHCNPKKDDIDSAIQNGFRLDCSKTVNPYGGGDAATKIYTRIKSISDFQKLIKKRFVDRGKPNSLDKPVYIIAEIGVNHNGSLKIAKQLVLKASKAGADAVKFQSFVAEELVSSQAKKASYQLRHTNKKQSQLEMLKQFELDEGAHLDLKKYCSKLGVDFLSTPFDNLSLKMLVHSVGVTMLKVPSGEITNAPFLLAMARTRLPLIVSTGMCDLNEVRRALQVLAFGYIGDRHQYPSAAMCEQALESCAGTEIMKQKVILLQCTTEYPAPFQDINLRAMDVLREEFGLRVGLSDHSAGWVASVAAVARDAKVIEKHFTLDRSLPGPDHAASLTPAEFSEMVQSIREVEQSLGVAVKSPANSEMKNKLVARRSIVARHNIKRGELFTDQNLTMKRPGTGLSGFEWDSVIGKRANRNFKKDEIIRL